MVTIRTDLLDISAVNIGKRNRMDWTAATEEEGDYYEVERSGNGRQFMHIGTVSAYGSSASYSFWDESPVPGINYYRLKMYDRAGRFTYSRTVTATLTDVSVFRMEA